MSHGASGHAYMYISCMLKAWDVSFRIVFSFSRYTLFNYVSRHADTEHHLGTFLVFFFLYTKSSFSFSVLILFSYHSTPCSLSLEYVVILVLFLFFYPFPYLLVALPMKT